MKRTAMVAALGVLLGFTSLRSSALWAQDTTQTQQSAWASGWSIGLPVYEGWTDFTALVIGYQAIRVRPNELGADIFVGTIPRAMIEGLIPIGARANVLLPIPLNESTAVLPTAGLTMFAAAGAYGAAARVGVNAGLSVLFNGRDKTGVRVGATRQHFTGFDSALWLLEIGFVIPRRH